MYALLTSTDTPGFGYITVGSSSEGTKLNQKNNFCKIRPYIHYKMLDLKCIVWPITAKVTEKIAWMGWSVS